MTRDDRPRRRPAHDPHDELHEEPAVDEHARRRTEALGWLDGALEQTTIDAVESTWAMLADATPSSRAHARATRGRLFWSSLSPVDGEVVDLDRWRASGTDDDGVGYSDGGAAAA